MNKTIVFRPLKISNFTNKVMIRLHEDPMIMYITKKLKYIYIFFIKSFLLIPYFFTAGFSSYKSRPTGKL